MMDRHTIERLEDSLKEPKDDAERLYLIIRSNIRSNELHEALLGEVMGQLAEIRRDMDAITGLDH
jgi:hypothetical protein